MTPIPQPQFLNRASECEQLNALLGQVRAGQSGALVIRGEPGIGKTALLGFLVDRAADLRIARTAGVESEMQLAFSGLHQLCAPMLGALDRLPHPQQRALSAAFGLTDPAAADPLLIGLAVLGLLSETARERPLLCVIDDGQWLDRASAQALGFVARRLGAEPVGMVIAVREPSGPEWGGLPELVVEGLHTGDAQTLLESVIAWPLDQRVRERILDETRGNPLALLELPRGLRPLDLAGGFGAPYSGELSRRMEDSFLRRLAELPEATRTLLLIAAADPVSERALVLRAAEHLGVGPDAAHPAAAAGLCEIGTWFRFRHPLVRSAAYRGASPAERRRAHRALAQVTDAVAAPDRRAWHRAHAASAPDEDVAADLDRSAGRARARGGITAAAAFLERATQLTPDPRRRGSRALAAAEAAHEAGANDPALRLLVTAEASALDSVETARIDLLRGRIAVAQRRGHEAPGLLLSAARRLETLDVALSREIYLEALIAANVAGRVAGGRDLFDVAQAARTAPPPPGEPRPADLLLDGLALTFTEGRFRGVPVLQQALRRFRDDPPDQEQTLRWHWFAGHVALCLWDYETHTLLADRLLATARETGALTVLMFALNSRIGTHMGAGELAQATALLEEVEAVAAATGTPQSPYIGLCLRALRGRERDISALLETVRAELGEQGEGVGLSNLQWVAATLYNALGRHEEALAAIRGAGGDPAELWYSTWGTIEIIEAAVRTGDTDLAATAFERLCETTQSSGTDLALGVEARSRALLTAGADAEQLYREAISLLAHTIDPVELARAHVHYGEWLRAEGRQIEARQHLKTAGEMFVGMGLEAFAERAIGDTPQRRRTIEPKAGLTAQEVQIARLAQEGLSNSEIGARLVISPRTVEYHLSKVFAKLGITSRRQLAGALSRGAPAPDH